jgi:hypothetical protein
MSRQKLDGLIHYRYPVWKLVTSLMQETQETSHLFERQQKRLTEAHMKQDKAPNAVRMSACTQ